MVITAQTLYSATAANAKEFAILLALGIPRWRISVMVLTQSFWVGVIGIVLAYPMCLGLRSLAFQFGSDVDLRWEVLAGTTVLTIGMALHRRRARAAQRATDRTDDASEVDRCRSRLQLRAFAGSPS